MRARPALLARLCLILLACQPGRARALSRGSAGADFLKIANGVRAVAMGNSYAAVGEDIYAVYWNPAGIANLSAPEGAFSYVKLFQSSQIEGVYLLTGAVEFPGVPFGYGNSGLGAMVLGTGSFDSTDPQALVRAASGAASDVLLFLTYSAPLTDAIAAGGSIKYVRRALTGADPSSFAVDPVTGDSVPTRSLDFQASGLGADAGVMWQNLDHTLAFGSSVQNMGTIGRFGQGFSFDLGGGEVLPVTFRLGSAYRVGLWGQKLLATADLTSFIDSFARPRLSLGAEYGLFGIAFLRAGWEQPLDQPLGKTALDFGKVSGLSSLPSPMRAGMGLRWPLTPGTMMQFDYALAPFGTLGAVHHAALLVRWNIEKKRKVKTEEAPAALEVRKVRQTLVIEPKQIKFDTPPKEWKVEVTDERGRVVKTFQGAGGLPPKELSLEGLTDEHGKLITDLGKFKIVTKAIDVHNKELKSTTQVASVSAEPQLKPVAGKPVYPEVVFVLPQGNYQLWQLQIQDAGRLVRTWQGQGTPTNPIVWDGKDGTGGTPVLGAPKYAWTFKDEEGKFQKGEKVLPQIEAEVKPEVLGNRIRMVGVRYRGMSTALTDEHRVILEKAAAFIAEHPASALTIEGYADAADDDEGNYDLAKARAERVLSALVDEYRLNATRITLRVYGRSRAAPRYPNLPDDEQSQRVDLVINVRR